MSGVILGPLGQLILIGGKALSASTASAVPTATIPLKPFYLVPSTGTARFVIQTTASSGDTAGDVPIYFDYTGGAPTSVWAKVIDTNNSNADVVPWTDISSTVSIDFTGKTGLGYLKNVPSGSGFKRVVRAGTNGVTYTDPATFNIGWMMGPWGQSNMVNTLQCDQGTVSRDTLIPGTSQSELQYYNADGTATLFGKNGFTAAGWNDVTIGDFKAVYYGALHFMRLVGKRLSAKIGQGRKVGIALNPWAQNATAMNGWLSADGTSINMLAANGGAAPNIGFSSYSTYPNVLANGDYRVVMWMQGETPESTDNPTTRTARFNRLKQFCQVHLAQVAKFGRPADKLTFLFAMAHVSTSAGATHMEVLRAAVLDLIEYGKAQTPAWDVRIGWNCVDLDPATVSDSLHFGGADRLLSLRRMLQATLNVVDSGTVTKGAKGPSIEGTVVTVDANTKYITGNAVRTGDTVRIMVTHDGGSTLTRKTPGSPITGCYANTAADFNGTGLTVTDVQTGTNYIDVTVKLADGVSSPPSTFYIKFYGHKFYSSLSAHPDVSNMIYDDFVYPYGSDPTEQHTGLPLQSTPNAIRVG